MNNSQLSRIVLRGFKSIRACDLEGIQFPNFSHNLLDFASERISAVR